MPWPKSPREVHVDVILNPSGRPLPPEADRPDGYDLPFELKSKNITIGAGNLMTFANDDRPGFLIYYHLKDPHGTGYLFPDDEREAMWSEKDQTCPKQESHWPQFRAKEVKSGNKVLVVRNLNQAQAKFGYTLRVTLNPSIYAPKFAHLDPPGDNTNGSWGFYSYSTTQSFLVAGAVATAAFVAMTSLGLNLVDDDVSLGIALLAAVTFGFAIAALWERRRES